jgi:hypothetical protein
MKMPLIARMSGVLMFVVSSVLGLQPIQDCRSRREGRLARNPRRPQCLPDRRRAAAHASEEIGIGAAPTRGYPAKHLTPGEMDNAFGAALRQREVKYGPPVALAGRPFGDSAGVVDSPMASDIDALTTRFCKALGGDTGRQPMKWRYFLVIGARCRIRAPKEIERIVAHGVKAGWLQTQDGHSVAQTEAGRRL